MDDKEKVKKRNRSWVIFLFLAGALAAAARPSIHFFEALIADGEPTAMTFTAAAILCGLIAIVLLSAIAGLLSLVHWPVIGTAILIFLITAACGAALYNSVQSMPPPAEKTPGTPRPTVTPPQVEIVTVERENGNPETGSVFYRRYGNERQEYVREPILLSAPHGWRRYCCYTTVRTVAVGSHNVLQPDRYNG